MAIRPIRTETFSTIFITVLTSISSLLGLFRDGHYADATDYLTRIYAQDVVLLAIGVPVLAIGLWFASRGSPRGRIVWLGSLAFMAYMWTHYAFVIAYNDFFLGYLALFGFSVFTLISGLVRTDPETFFERLHDTVSTRLYAGFLAVAAAGLGLCGCSISSRQRSLESNPLQSHNSGRRLLTPTSTISVSTCTDSIPLRMVSRHSPIETDADTLAVMRNCRRVVMFLRSCQ